MYRLDKQSIVGDDVGFAVVGLYVGLEGGVAVGVLVGLTVGDRVGVCVVGEILGL